MDRIIEHNITWIERWLVPLKICFILQMYEKNLKDKQKALEIVIKQKEEQQKRHEAQ